MSDVFLLIRLDYEYEDKGLTVEGIFGMVTPQTLSVLPPLHLGRRLKFYPVQMGRAKNNLLQHLLVGVS